MPHAENTIQRDAPQETPQARKSLVDRWIKEVQEAKAYHDTSFKRMRRDMAFVHGMQWADQKNLDDERYVANLTLRHLSRKTASLYAKNPKAIAERRDRLDFELWDERPESLMQAQQTLALAQEGQALPPDAVMQAQELMADVQRGKQYREQIERVAKTLEVVYKHQIGQQIPNFKQQMKQLIRRAATTGVGYVKLSYRRRYEPSPEHANRVSDVSKQLAFVKQQMQDLADNEAKPYEAEAEELRQTLEMLQKQEDVVVREGLDVDFPSATSIIPDKDCHQLNGFLGARWVAHEFLLTPDQVQQYYDVDIRSRFTSYTEPTGSTTEGPKPSPEAGDGSTQSEGSERKGLAAVWEIYDQMTGLVYTVCDGYPEFLRDPHAPYCKLEQFYPFFALTLNEIEDEGSIFPPSDVTLIRPMQQEHNVSRERMREHRDANRPGYVAPKGKMSDQDKQRLSNSEAHAVTEIDGLQQGDDIRRLIQPKPFMQIDPNLYEVGTFFDDLMKTSGSQEAVLGGTSGSTATESNIAEAARMTAIESNIDDLDEFLTDIARGASYILLTEMSAQTAREIAGPGASWPEVTADEVARDLWLTIRAGSSGRPNKAQEVQNFERLAPILMQIPGISPKWLAEQAIERLDDRIDLTDAYLEGLESIASMNRSAGDMQQDEGTAGNAPRDQGGEGGNNASKPPQSDSNQGPNNDAPRGQQDNQGSDRPSQTGSGFG